MSKNIRENDQERAMARKLLEAKIEDKYQFAVTRNKITHTDFLNASEKRMAEAFLQQNGWKNTFFFGGNGKDSERNILLCYPDKFSRELVEKNLSQIVVALSIILPKDLVYEHRVYLSGMMKLGIKREKIGDILVRENGADIIVLKEMADFLQTNLLELTRFKSAKIEVVGVDTIEPKAKEFQKISVIVSSMRLDNFVSELARCSRSRAVEILNAQRVFVNDELQTKFSRKIVEGDIINIRGKGKFVIEEVERKTKGDKFAVNVEKYV